jgi:predicted transcriptional regulator
MELYKIGTENDVRVYKKTKLGNIAFVIICVLLLLSGSFFGTTCYYRSKYTRLVEQNRVELELARARSAVLTDTITRAREESSNIRESLSRQRTSVSELRALITEVRTRYEKMEELLFSVRWDDSDVRNIDSGTTTDNGE